MKIRATTNQLGLAPMRIPKTRASWIDRVPIPAHGGRRAQARAPNARLTGHASSVPRRMPRVGNLRLSVKLSLCFGAILALTAAIIAVDLVNIQGLRSAHERVTQRVVPADHGRQRADAAFADTHFAQTQMVLADGGHRSDELGDLMAFDAALDVVRSLADNRADMARIDAAVNTFKQRDAELYAMVRRGDRVGATGLVSSSVDEAATV